MGKIYSVCRYIKPTTREVLLLKNLLIHLIVLTIPSFGILPSAQATESAQTRIHAVLDAYEQALNASDVSAVLKLYTRDGVFMAQHNRPAVGIDAVKAAYQAVFKAIDLDIKFDIREIDVIADDWAFARTNSAGTTTINATGDKVSEGNQELFLLRKTPDGWKIARYIFSTTNPR